MLIASEMMNDGVELVVVAILADAPSNEAREDKDMKQRECVHRNVLVKKIDESIVLD